MWQKITARRVEYPALDAPVNPERFGAIAKAIASDGFWQKSDEWRMCVVTASRIEKSEKYGKLTIYVTVKCDYEFACHCPTLERAVYYQGVYPPPAQA